MQSVTQNRFSPMTYPLIIVSGMLIVLGGLGWQNRTTPNHWHSLINASVDRGSLSRFAAVIGGILLYGFLAERLGFLLAASLLLLTLLLWLRTRLVPALVITACLIPSLYFVFATVLRVPLPQGWLG